MNVRTHGFDNLGVSNVVDNDFAHLGEMPPVPFLRSERGLDEPRKYRQGSHYLNTHGIDVDFLV